MKRNPDLRQCRIVAPDAIAPRAWWARHWFLALIVLASAVPLLGPAMPPLIDLPGHMAMYHVELHGADHPALARLFAWHWSLIGNLGAELLVLPLGKALGLEPAVKLIVIAIPMLTVAGLLVVAREAHGTVPPTAFFALPVTYSFPFQYGFVNYTLSAALMPCMVGGWMRLGRGGRFRWRAALFVPGAALLFVVHSVGWAFLGLAIGGVELASGRADGLRWDRAVLRASRRCWPLLPSVLMLLTWADAAADPSSGFGIGILKLVYALGILWNGWPRVAMGATLLLYGILLAACVRARLRFEPRIGVAALLLGGLYLAMPARAIGSCFADMRIAPYAVGLALAAVTPTRTMGARGRTILAAAGLMLWAGWLGVQTASYRDIAHRQSVYLAAIDHIPPAARLFAVTGDDCSGRAMTDRLDHLSNLALVRRDAFVNGVWIIPSGQLVHPLDPRDRSLFYGRSSGLRLPSCGALAGSTAAMMRTFRQSRADYLWLIAIPRSLWPTDARLHPVWSASDSVLYRVDG